MARGLISTCWHLTVSGDLVAQDLKLVDRAALHVGLCFVDGVIERGDDCRDLLVIDSVAVPQPRHDGPDSQLRCVIHGEVLP